MIKKTRRLLAVVLSFAMVLTGFTFLGGAVSVNAAESLPAIEHIMVDTAAGSGADQPAKDGVYAWFFVGDMDADFEGVSSESFTMEVKSGDSDWAESDVEAKFELGDNYDEGYVTADVPDNTEAVAKQWRFKYAGESAACPVITQAAGESAAQTEITKMDFDKTEYSSGNAAFTVTLEGTGLDKLDAGNFKLEYYEYDWEAYNYPVAPIVYKADADGAKASVSFEVSPSNAKYRFTVKDFVAASVTNNPQELTLKKAVYTGITVDPAELTADGGKAVFTVSGSNLDMAAASDFRLFKTIVDPDAGPLPTDSNLNATLTPDADGTSLKVEFTLPANDTDEDQEYSLRVLKPESTQWNKKYYTESELSGARTPVVVKAKGAVEPELTVSVPVEYKDGSSAEGILFDDAIAYETYEVKDGVLTIAGMKPDTKYALSISWDEPLYDDLAILGTATEEPGDMLYVGTKNEAEPKLYKWDNTSNVVTDEVIDKIVLINVVEESAKATKASEKALKDAEDAQTAYEEAKKAAEEAKPGTQDAVDKAKAAEEAAKEAAEKAEAAVNAAEAAKKAAQVAWDKEAEKAADDAIAKANDAKTAAETAVTEAGENVRKATEAKEAADKEAAEKAAEKAKYTPAKVKILKAAKGKKKATVTWKTVKKNVTGYNIQFINKKTGKAAKTVTVKQTKSRAKKKTIKKVVKKLKKGTYKVRVRAYNVVNGKTFYGEWSKSKTVKVKK